MAKFKIFLLQKFHYIIIISVIANLLWNVGANVTTRGAGRDTYIPVHVGVVLNLNSDMGAMADVCISMALEDFYSAHSDYRTGLVLHTKDAQDDLDVVSEVVELLKNEDVHGILGPQALTEDTFAAELGRKAQVPVISFTSRSQPPSIAKDSYFIRTTSDNSNQVKALAAICKRFEWHEVVILYEDSHNGNQFASELNSDFLREDIQLAYMIPVSASAADHQINGQLRKLTTIQTRVFIVHMNIVLGSRFFLLARRAGMMSEGYAWLVTDAIGNFLNSVDSLGIESMEGVLGIRPHVPKSQRLENFKERWKKNMILKKSASTKVELNVYGLWAYDTVWALAMAVEKLEPNNTSLSKLSNGENGSYISSLRLSQFGPKLLAEIKKTTLPGLSGEFKLIEGELKSSALEVFNVVETGGRTIGYWAPDGGITRNLASSSYTASKEELKTIVWPGDSVRKPLGWSIPATGKIKVAIPKKSGFPEFVNATVDPVTNKTINATGFSIDIFLSTLKILPFEVEPDFIAFDPEGTSYTDFVNSLTDKDFSIMVGDTTILADRAKYVDFSLPYSESGVVWVVKNKQEKNMWVFIKPFRWDLWLTILATCIFIGAVLRILEYQANYNSGSHPRLDKHQLGLLFWFPISVLAFPERNMVANKWSRFVLVLWLFMSFILMQSYTANLSAMFTVDQLDFRFSRDYYVGYQVGSFVKDFLINHLHISETKLRSYSSIEEYHEAMIKGGKNGGIDAIVDEIPYMNVLLNQYGSRYKILGPRYRADGFGFAFPKNSPLVVYFSRAILDVTESADMSRIEERNFGPRYSSDILTNSINKQSNLTAYNFGGLFIIIGSAMLCALFCAVPSGGPKLVGLATVYTLKCFSFLPFCDNNLRSNSMVHPEVDSNHSSSEQEVQMSRQDNIGTNLAVADTDNRLGQENSNARRYDQNRSAETQN